METISFDISKESAAVLRVEASKRHSTVSDVIREVLESLDSRGTVNCGEWTDEEMQILCDKLRSGFY